MDEPINIKDLNADVMGCISSFLDSASSNVLHFVLRDGIVDDRDEIDDDALGLYSPEFVKIFAYHANLILVFQVAFEYENIPLLDWFAECEIVVVQNYKERMRSCKSLVGLKWLASHGLLPHDIFKITVRGGCLEVVQWLWDNKYCKNHKNVMYEAAKRGMSMVEWVVNHGVELNSDIYKGAAIGGHMDLIEWADARGCPIDLNHLCKEAINGGNLSIVKWAISCGAEWDYSSSALSSHKNRSILEYAIANGMDWTNFIYTFLARNGSFDMIKIMYSMKPNISLPADVLYQALVRKNMNMVEWGLSNGASLEAAIAGAIETNDIAMMERLFKLGAPLTSDGYKSALSVAVLEWLKEHNCRMEEDVARYVAWLIRNGCNWDPTKCIESTTINSGTRIRNWIARKTEHI
jgi:hypothetical protein